ASGLVEVIELAHHPFFIGVQYHPELKSTVENPQPIFVNFVKATMAYSNNVPGGPKSESAKVSQQTQKHIA
ncbi:MAG: hypothetical protein QM594_15735, partial [Niabella sp.]